ncbi:mechanosensitive ion channel family protein [Taylorella equigenitalis]|uniref:Small-conductance mechanosensitive channel n=3 Tax=Taylorella equigenitalis TaxID=29575 RepID=A0A654KIG1_TAYEM|nr:mechanosensitive ion channel family protein [Taylorella equigenitalis]ADU92114.1 Small-conductance mechanosensitive channel [Taylorella equigenitalis MCE9]AFN35675.1 putative ion channel protein [Taylorella equigenitalis ATCC 35865]ASY30322.1 mechanosensitive ion channel protein MscS [Taylorella equigenitalis]ASY37627.1 mechanosensitive ion channel family protein [Taylorella equigenitalis]ASY39095.1 mechanosensitive ion channel protein MscS [Taylorella equigenitalis]
MNTHHLWTEWGPWINKFLVNFLSAAAILVIGWMISNLVGKGLKGVLTKTKAVDRTAMPMITAIAVWAVRVVVVLIVLTQFGVETASLIAALGAAGLAIGLALQGTLQNIASGIMLIALRPLNSGDYITIHATDVSGTVVEVGLFLTKLVKLDGMQVTVPNSVVWGSQITNFSKSKQRRMDLQIPISYGDDLDKAIKVLNDLISHDADVLTSPKHEVLVTEYKDSVVIVTARVWADASVFWDLQAKLMKDIRKYLEQNGFKLPVPIQLQTFQSPNALREAMYEATTSIGSSSKTVDQTKSISSTDQPKLKNS